MDKIFIYDINELDDISKKILNLSTSKKFIFDGKMGAGKTTLIKSMIKSIGCVDLVTSPTFSIINEYLMKDSNIFHFDFYRIQNQNEALDIGFEDYINDDNWCFIEWPCKVKSLLPDDINIIQINIISDLKRELVLKN